MTINRKLSIREKKGILKRSKKPTKYIKVPKIKRLERRN